MRRGSGRRQPQIGSGRDNQERQQSEDRWQRDMQRKLEWEAKLRDSYPGSETWRAQVQLEPNYVGHILRTTQLSTHAEVSENQEEEAIEESPKLIPSPPPTPDNDHGQETPRQSENIYPAHLDDCNNNIPMQQPQQNEPLAAHPSTAAVADAQDAEEAEGTEQPSYFSDLEIRDQAGVAQAYFASNQSHSRHVKEPERSGYEEERKEDDNATESDKSESRPNRSPDSTWYEQKKRQFLNRERHARDRYWYDAKMQSARQLSQAVSPQPNVHQSPPLQVNQALQSPAQPALVLQPSPPPLQPDVHDQRMQLENMEREYLQQQQVLRQNMHQQNMLQQQHYHQNMQEHIYHFHNANRYYQRRFYYQSTRPAVTESRPGLRTQQAQPGQYFYNYGLPGYQGPIYPNPRGIMPPWSPRYGFNGRFE